MSQILLAFITGLTTGGLSCFAVQGGLLTGILAEQKKEQQKKTIIMFLSAKVASHLLLGALLGAIGSAILISSTVQGWMQILAGLFMITVALKLSDAHPFFRRLTFTPPKSFFRVLRIQSKNESMFTPAILGFLTILIPCGTTQAMMLLAVSSGSALYGALILGSFVLGSSPLFFLLGLASEKILAYKPLKIVAIGLIAYLAFASINSGQVLRGSNHTFQNYKAVIFENGKSKNVAGSDVKIIDGKQQATIEVTSAGYKSVTKSLKVGVPVKLTIKSNNVQSCARAFVIPNYGINKLLPANGTETVEFTPTKLGKLTYACSMGMYTGFFNVVE